MNTLEREQKYLLQNYGPRTLEIVSAKGCWVYSSDNQKLLDFTSGIGVNALGHCHPAIVQAIQAQSQKLIHCSNFFLNYPVQKLAEMLCNSLKAERAFFCNSGTEATEAGIKIARKYFSQRDEARQEIISFFNSFHGRTYGALAATGQPRFKQSFGPMPAGFRHVEFGDAGALQNAIDNKTAAILFEPVQGEGGVHPLPREMVDVLRDARKKGVLLIADEIQTGLGRCGKMLGCDLYDLKPDMVLLAKPLGGGLPLGAVLMRQNIADAIMPGDHGTTFGGNPVSCAAGVAFLEEIMTPDFRKSFDERSGFFRTTLEKMLAEKRQKGTACGVVRGAGFLLGFPFEGDLAGLIFRCRGEGLLILKAGTDVVRLMPPLNASIEELSQGIEILGKCLE